MKKRQKNTRGENRVMDFIKKVISINQSSLLLKIPFYVAFILYGGFFDWNTALIGAVLCVCLFLCWCENKKENINGVKRQRRWVDWLPEIFILFEILVSFWAVDAGDNLAGILKGVVVLLWIWLCTQYAPDERDGLLKEIPLLGAAMVVLGIAGLLTDTTRNFFWSVERFGGLFQYANTCALFLLLGLRILLHGWTENSGQRWSKKWFFEIGKGILLLTGILLSGSRSVLLLGILWGIIHSVCNKKFRKYFICIAAGIAVLSGIVYFLTGSGTQNISRIFTILSSNSTLYGRLLYDIDALSIIGHHPMGLGYMGYYYVQHAFQTGIYLTRYVHNDILQICLDYGFVPLVLFLVYFVWQLVRGKQSALKKELLLMITAASLVDFHLQYLIIVFVMVLCCDSGGEMVKQKRAERIENRVLTMILLACFMFFFIPYLAIFNGNYQIALKFLPGNTKALYMAMADTGDKDEALAYAERILEHNSYFSEAYHVIMYAALMDGDMVQMMENMDTVLRLEKYDANRYKSYDTLLAGLAESAAKSGQDDASRLLEEKRGELREKLAALQEQTNPIAFKLRDVPQFTY